MKIGSTVKLIIAPATGVKEGAVATVVDGPATFPFLYRKLLTTVGEHSDEFIWVKWDKGYWQWQGAKDGAYAEARFELLEDTDEEPEDNDGRSTCYWCTGPTERRAGFSSMYDVCPECDR